MRRMEARRARAASRAHARRDGRLRHHQTRTDRALWCTGGRAGRRADQAGKAGVRHARTKPSRVVSQNALGHGQGRAGHPHQAGRPHAQHAHHGRHAARQVGPHQPRNPGNLRAHCPPLGPELHLPRAARPVVSIPVALALPGAQQGFGEIAQAPHRPDRPRQSRGAASV